MSKLLNVFKRCYNDFWIFFNLSVKMEQTPLVRNVYFGHFTRNKQSGEK